MQIDGPERYRLTISSTNFVVRCDKGTAKFSGISTNRLPKIYVVSIEGKPIYVGLTKRSMRERLRVGWSATGESGYYGYSWRHKMTEGHLDVWCHTDAIDRNERDLETIEAEVVFMIRQSGQWPEFQTEIHFHPSNEEHRYWAERIFGHYVR